MGDFERLNFDPKWVILIRPVTTAKDGRLVLAATWHDDIILWDAETRQEIARQRITNHHNGAGRVVYDEAKDRFLIADPSWKGVKYLRALTVTKRPSRIP